MLSGNKSFTTHYLIDQNNIRQYSKASQETLHINIWRRIYQEEEIVNETTHMVNNFLDNKLHRITQFSSADPTRLNADPVFTRSINTQDITNII